MVMVNIDGAYIEKAYVFKVDFPDGCEFLLRADPTEFGGERFAVYTGPNLEFECGHGHVVTTDVPDLRRGKRPE